MQKIEIPFNVGTVTAAADYLIDQARNLVDVVEADFNGTPMIAKYWSPPESVALRWHYERLLIQIANGAVDVKDYADDRYLTSGVKICHCGQPVHYNPQIKDSSGNPFTRGLCVDCDSVRCDAPQYGEEYSCYSRKL